MLIYTGLTLRRDPAQVLGERPAGRINPQRRGDIRKSWSSTFWTMRYFRYRSHTWSAYFPMRRHG